MTPPTRKLSGTAFATLLLIALMMGANHVAARLAFNHGVDVATAVTFRSAVTALVLHVIGYLMCLREPRWLDLWIQKVSRCPRVKNYAHWRCNSYSP